MLPKHPKLRPVFHPFRIPTLLITWRGGPGVADEPQHELMGAITPELLDVMRIRNRPFPKSADEVPAALAETVSHMETTGLPFAMIMEKSDAMAALLDELPADAAIIATTGKCGRELFTLADREQHLYQVGSMGCAAAMGLTAADLLAFGDDLLRDVGAGLFVAAMILDRADGDLARLTGRTSADDHVYDLVSDTVCNAIVFIGLGIGLRGGAFGMLAIHLGFLAGAAVAAVLWLVMRIEETEGSGAAELGSFAGFDPHLDGHG